MILLSPAVTHFVINNQLGVRIRLTSRATWERGVTVRWGGGGGSRRQALFVIDVSMPIIKV